MGREGNKPLHLDRLRLRVDGRGSRGKMQRMRAELQVLEVVGMVVGRGPGA
jgi:hypothetical protein